MTTQHLACLSLEESAESFSFDFCHHVYGPRDWIKLRQTPSFQQVTVSNLNLSNPDHRQHLFNLVLAIKSYPEVTKICFKSCCINDLGPMLCEAIAGLHELVMHDVTFNFVTFSQIMESIAANPSIQCLDLSKETVSNVDEIQSLCNVLLRGNKGPRKLVIDLREHSPTTLIEAMQVNTSLKALTIGAVSETEILTFAEGLASTRGLRKLAFLGRCISEEFCKRLQQSLEHNTALWTVSFENGIEYINIGNFEAAKYMSRIRYLLAINRVGRHQLMTAPIPESLWALLLARVSNEPDGIYFVLTEKPEIAT